MIYCGLTEINEELDDLEAGDPLLPPDLDATSALEIVPVHDNVDSQVKGDNDPGDGSRADELGVAEQSSCAMMVAVKEGERLLLEEEEARVQQLEVLGQVVQLEGLVLASPRDSTCTTMGQKTYVVQDDQGLGPTALSIANRMEQTVTNNSRQNLLNEQSKQNGADGSEVEVVDQEKSAQLEGLAVAHHLAAAEDDKIVEGNEDASLLKGRQRCLARNEAEVISRIASDLLEDLVEDGPEMNAKGAVNGRHGQLPEQRHGRCGRHCGKKRDN